MITLTKQDIENIVAKARDYLEAHKATNWTNWDEEGVVSKITDDNGLLKVAIMSLFISSYKDDDYTVTRTNEEVAKEISDAINKAHTYGEVVAKMIFEDYIGSYIKIAA